VGELIFGARELAELLDMLAADEINPAGARLVLAELFAKGGKPAKIVKAMGLEQVTDTKQTRVWVSDVLDKNPQQVRDYLGGNAPLLNWLFGQVMQTAGGKANPKAVREELQRQLEQRNLEGETSNG
jgi:Asp-tRNA(Asn)/Glu-tRNA(Gln) amidotransferase B subunit